MSIFRRKRSQLELEDQFGAELLKNIAESVFNSVELQKQLLTEFENGLVSSLTLILSNKRISKNMLQEINAVIADIKFGQKKRAEGDNSWEQLERGATCKGLTIYLAYKETPREHFLKSLNLIREKGAKEEPEDEEAFE